MARVVMMRINRLFMLSLFGCFSLFLLQAEAIYVEMPLNHEHLLCLEFHPEFFRNNNGSLIFGALAQACDHAGKVVNAQTEGEKQQGVFGLFGTAFNLASQLSQPNQDKKSIGIALAELAEVVQVETLTQEIKIIPGLEPDIWNVVFSLPTKEERALKIIEICNDEVLLDDFLYVMQRHFQRVAIKKVIAVKEALTKNFVGLIREFSADSNASFPSLQELDALGIMPQSKKNNEYNNNSAADLVSIYVKKIQEEVEADNVPEVTLAQRAERNAFGVISAYKGTLLLSEALCDLLAGNEKFTDDLMRYEPLFIEELLNRESGRDRAEFAHKAFRYPGVACEMIDEILAGLMLFGCNAMNTQLRRLFTATYCTLIDVQESDSLEIVIE